MATNGWKPSRREQHILWWLQLIMRYGVGGGGLVWEALVDKLKNPYALLVFGALATALDVFSYLKALVKQAREETVGLEHELEREVRRQRDSPSEP
jgi:hypothetical protein